MNLSKFLSGFGLVLKWAAVLVAIVKGLEVVKDELEKSDLFAEPKKESEESHD